MRVRQLCAGFGSHLQGIDIDGAGAVPVQLQGAQVFPVKRIKAFLFTGIHGVNSSVDCPTMGY